jgi:hypothetical protein
MEALGILVALGRVRQVEDDRTQTDSRQGHDGNHDSEQDSIHDGGEPIGLDSLRNRIMARRVFFKVV